MNSRTYPTGIVAKGAVAPTAASNTSTMARASRFWPRLGGSVDSRICCSANAPVRAVAGGAPARETGEGALWATSCISGTPASLQRLVDQRYRRLCFERLAEEAQRSPSHRARLDPIFGKRRDKDDRYLTAPRQQQPLQLYPAQARHLQIGDQAGGVILMRRIQKLFRRCKRAYIKTQRAHQASQGRADRFIVIDDRDDRHVRQMITLGPGKECGDAAMCAVT